MKLASLIALAAVFVANAASAQAGPDKKCGAGACSKKEISKTMDKEASSSKKDASCSKK